MFSDSAVIDIQGTLIKHISVSVRRVHRKGRLIGTEVDLGVCQRDDTNDDDYGEYDGDKGDDIEVMTIKRISKAQLKAHCKAQQQETKQTHKRARKLIKGPKRSQHDRGG